MTNQVNTIETVGQTPEAVAYQLMSYILRAEKANNDTKFTREDILSTYAESLETVRGNLTYSNTNLLKANR